MNTQANNDWVARSLASVWHPCTQMQHHESIPMVSLSQGRGAWLMDHAGHRYIDGISSWWVNLFGHANPRINHALKEQLDQLEHAMLAGFTHEPVVQLSEQLSALTQGVLGHCFYASDGASAVEIALKMSFHAWANQGLAQKQEFIYLQGGYHGETVGALAVTDVPLFRQAYGAMLQPAHVVATPDARNAKEGETAADVALRAAEDIRRLLEQRADHIAAIILEPLVQCAGGMIMHDPVYMQTVRALCDEFKVHLIADEIAVGCGRTGTFFASEQSGVWPDFLCLSKGISGGYLPLSLVMTRKEIYQAFYHSDIARAFLHSHSYTGNPLACRAALATLAIFKEDDVLAQNKLRGDKIEAALAPLKNHPRSKNFRRRGMIFAFDAQPDEQAGFARRYFAQGLQQQILLRPIGNTVYLMPPYIINDEEINCLATGAIKALEASC